MLLPVLIQLSLSELMFPQVGFESVTLRLTDIVAGTGQAVITRKGVYGSVTVNWISGYPPDLITDFAQPGNITPTFGKYSLEKRAVKVALVVIPPFSYWYLYTFPLLM